MVWYKESKEALRSGNSANLIFASDPIIESMFARLFFYEGAGLKHFEKFSEKTTFTNDKIIVWKVEY